MLRLISYIQNIKTRVCNVIVLQLSFLLFFKNVQLQVFQMHIKIFANANLFFLLQ